MAVSSPNPQSKKKFHVFISFHGEETRRNIRAFICKGLREKGIDYFDDEGFPRGENIEPSILNAINDSRLSIVIFSKLYPNSTWCLDELVHIFDCMSHEQENHKVLPLFYNIDPSAVQQRKENYKDSKLIMHLAALNKVIKWRKALDKISNISGIVASHFK